MKTINILRICAVRPVPPQFDSLGRLLRRQEVAIDPRRCHCRTKSRTTDLT
jgi:hypothetical protein